MSILRGVVKIPQNGSGIKKNLDICIVFIYNLMVEICLFGDFSLSYEIFERMT